MTTQNVLIPVSSSPLKNICTAQENVLYSETIENELAIY